MRLPRHSASYFFIVIIAGLTLGCSLTRGQGAAPDPTALRFDAAWWMHASSAEQEGFIYGYLDCRQPLKRAKASIADYQESVSIAMKMSAASNADAVTEAIEQAAKALKSRDTSGAENYDGAHGFLDGEW